MVKILINGSEGRMGKVISSLVKSKDDCEIACGVDINGGSESFPVYKSINDVPSDTAIDVIIDFSHPSAFSELLEFALARNIPLVAATTGLSKDADEEIEKATKKIPVFRSANMSLGICLLKELAKKAADFLGEDYDIEIIEKHHNKKLDAPSGTALAIADAINGSQNNAYEYTYDRQSIRRPRSKREIGISSVRGGNIVGEHEVLYIGGNEIIEITHKAQSRDVFADGAIRAALFLAGKPAGLYGMEDLL